LGICFDVSHGVRADYARLKILLYGNQYVWTPIAYPTQRTFSAHLDIDYWSDYQLDFKVEIKTIDTNGNVMTVTQTVSSAWFGLLKDVWNAIVEFFKTVKEKALEVLDALVDWVVEKVKAAYASVVNAIKSAVRGVLESYRNLLVVVGGWLESAVGSASSTSGFESVGRERYEGVDVKRAVRAMSFVGDILEAIEEFIAVEIEIAMVAMGVFMAAMAVMITVKAATLGIGAFVSSILYQKVLKELLFSMVLNAAVMGTFYELSGLFREGEEPDKGLAAIVGFLGITGSAVEKLYTIGDAFLDAIQRKTGLIGYYIGIFLAFTGILTEAATSTLSGDLLKWAELAAIIISVIGLAQALWKLGKDLTTKTHEEASPLVTGIEIAIGSCGLVSAIVKYLHDNGGA